MSHAVTLRPMQPVASGYLPPDVGPADLSIALSVRLREETARRHRVIEERIDLPRSIATRADYLSCLRRFHSLYQPLETSLAAFSDWTVLGIDLAARSRVTLLAEDLRWLDPARPLPAPAPPAALPHLPSFAHAFGAQYVLEGSALGSQLVHRHLLRIGLEGAETAHFFAASGPAVSTAWRRFRFALDFFGASRPAAVPHVIAGAERTFDAIGAWMDASRWRAST